MGSGLREGSIESLQIGARIRDDPRFDRTIAPNDVEAKRCEDRTAAARATELRFDERSFERTIEFVD